MMLRRCCRYGLLCELAHTPDGVLRPQQGSAECRCLIFRVEAKPEPYCASRQASPPAPEAPGVLLDGAGQQLNA